MKQSEALKEVRENLIKKLGENEVYPIKDFDRYGAIQTVKFLDSFIPELSKKETINVLNTHCEGSVYIKEWQKEEENTCITA